MHVSEKVKVHSISLKLHTSVSLGPHDHMVHTSTQHRFMACLFGGEGGGGGAFELLEKLVEGVCIVEFYNIYLSSLHIKCHKCSSKLPLFISFSCLFYYCISPCFFCIFFTSCTCIYPGHWHSDEYKCYS
jgi:hypothetical protein